MIKNTINEGYEKNKDLFTSSIGSKVFIKKKKFIDLSMCAGSILLGHNHSIYRKTIKECLKNKISNIAAPNIHAETFTNNIKKTIPNSKKIIFCNSGTEAVTKSLRLARAISKKKFVGYVTGGWHGSVDQLLFKPNKLLKPIKISGGITHDHSKNLVMIPYNNIKKTKSILDKNKKKLSCIIIEPVQGSLPYKNIKTYLKFLELFCKKNNILLIFDEMITGLRTECSSAQNYFNVSADISIFGKCYGAGFPLGFISITNNVYKKMVKLDQKVFFGGTFSGNSTITYIANNILKFIIKNKKKIFKQLENSSSLLENKLNRLFLENNLDLKMYRFKSMLRLVYTGYNLKDRPTRDFFEIKKNKNIMKFKNYLFKNKIFLSSSGLIFLSIAHNKRDLDYIINHFKIGLKKNFKK